MNHSPEDIRSLIFEKLDNQIDPENDRLLKKLIGEPGAARDMWDEIQQFYSSEKGKTVMKNIDPVHDWSVLEHKLKKPVNRQHRIRYITATVAAACLVAVAFILFKPSTTRKYAAEHVSKGIIFQVENDSPINLSDTSNKFISAGGAVLSNTGNTLSYKPGHSTQWTKLSVPEGLDYKILLADSSVLWMNAATTVRFPLSFSGSTREIELSGEAYLEVAPKPSQPFIVHLPGMDVEVLGTRFNMNTYNSDKIEVALVNGKVKLAASGHTIELKPGELSSLQGGRLLTPEIFDQHELLAWTRGEYIFYNAPVSEIAQVIRRLYAIDVVVENSVANKRFTGIIDKNKAISLFLDNLTETSELSCLYHGEVLHLK